MIAVSSDVTTANKQALAYSKANPSQYVTLQACFGLFLSTSKRLNVFAPSDSVGGTYWKAGKVRTFTNKQRIADQRATPTMS